MSAVLSCYPPASGSNHVQVQPAGRKRNHQQEGR
jgi:hypothetical protein